jgi:hypothetical protein
MAGPLLTSRSGGAVNNRFPSPFLLYSFRLLLTAHLPGIEVAEDHVGRR